MKALEGLKGVKSARVSFREKRAYVSYEQEVVTVEQMIEVVNKAGFQASIQ